MTDRAEIERLLNMTGRTLEGLPESYEPEEAMKAYKRGKERGWTLGEVILHQSDVIELLVGALRDALPSEKQEHDCGTCGEEYCDVHFYPCCACHNTAPRSMSKWHPEGTEALPREDIT